MKKSLNAYDQKKNPLKTRWERSAHPNLPFFGEVVPVGWVKLCQGFIPASVTRIVTVGWVKPPAAYPAKTSMTLNLDKPMPV